MKKSTKKTIMAFSIILIFGMSSIAFLTPLFTGTPQAQQQEFKQLESPVVQGQLSSVYKATYIQNGFTWLEYYYEEPDQQFLGFIDSLPQSFTAPSGEPQLIVQKLNQKYLNESDYIIISSPVGIDSFAGKDQGKIFADLCNFLTFRPIECDLENLTNPPAANDQSETPENATETSPVS